MKKILFIIPSFGMGGVEKVLINISNALDKLGYKITIINLTTGIDMMKMQLNNSIRYIEVQPKRQILKTLFKYRINNPRILPFRLWLKFHSPQYLYKQYVKDEYDIEIAFFIGYGVKIISGSTNSHSKKITWLHSEKMPFRDLSQGFTSAKASLAAYKKFDRIVCVSSRIATKFSEKTKIKQNVEILYNFNPSKKIVKFSEEINNDLSKERFTIVTVGRFVHEKGFDRLLEVANMLNRDNISYSLWIIGDGPERNAMERYIKENKLMNVKFLGIQSNPYKYMKMADLYVCPSRHEGFSMVLCEAIILGIPMVCTDCSGVDDILDNGSYGIITENNTESLYKGVKTVLEDPNTYAKYKKLAEMRASFFDEDHMLAQLEDLFI